MMLTGDQGFLCRNVYVREAIDTKHEFFIGIALDRDRGCPVIKYSEHGHLPYEEIMKRFPEDMNCIYVDVMKGVDMKLLLTVADTLGISQQKSQLTFILKHLYDLFMERDGEIVELAPLILSKDNQLIVSHAKIKIDESSLYR